MQYCNKNISICFDEGSCSFFLNIDMTESKYNWCLLGMVCIVYPFDFVSVCYNQVVRTQYTLFTANLNKFLYLHAWDKCLINELSSMHIVHYGFFSFVSSQPFFLQGLSITVEILCLESVKSFTCDHCCLALNQWYLCVESTQKRYFGFYAWELWDNWIHKDIL